MKPVNITEGWTARLGPFTLLVKLTEDDPGTPLDLTGMTAGVSMVLRSADGIVVTTGGAIVIPLPATGQVFYDPAAADFVHKSGPYDLHIKVIDGNGKVAYFPDGPAGKILVARA